MNYPVLVGNGREDVQEAFGPLFGIPVSVIIGRDGVIAKKHSGIATKEQIEREIKTLFRPDPSRHGCSMIRACLERLHACSPRLWLPRRVPRGRRGKSSDRRH